MLCGTLVTITWLHSYICMYISLSNRPDFVNYSWYYRLEWLINCANKNIGKLIGKLHKQDKLDCVMFIISCLVAVTTRIPTYLPRLRLNYYLRCIEVHGHDTLLIQSNGMWLQQIGGWISTYILYTRPHVQIHMQGDLRNVYLC